MYEYACQAESAFVAGIKKIVLPYAFGNIHFEGDIITGIEEKPDIVTYALAGIYVMKPEILALIPQGQYFGIDKLLQKMLQEKMPIIKYEIKDYWLDIGRIDDYEQAQKDYQKFDESVV
jgi:NDP-sugar pyrophosphorylase family protein